jgi:hypothetical protein
VPSACIASGSPADQVKWSRRPCCAARPRPRSLAAEARGRPPAGQPLWSTLVNAGQRWSTLVNTGQTPSAHLREAAGKREERVEDRLRAREAAARRGDECHRHVALRARVACAQQRPPARVSAGLRSNLVKSNLVKSGQIGSDQRRVEQLPRSCRAPRPRRQRRARRAPRHRSPARARRPAGGARGSGMSAECRGRLGAEAFGRGVD